MATDISARAMRRYRVTDTGTVAGRGIVARTNILRGALILRAPVQVFADPPVRPPSQDHAPTDLDVIFVRAANQWVLLRDHSGCVRHVAFF